MRTSVTSKGQVTIPKALRDMAHISAGTQVDFQITDNGYLIVRPVTQDISKLKGIAKQEGQAPVSLTAMKNAIKEGLEESIQ